VGIFEDVYIKAKTIFGVLSSKTGQFVDVAKLKVEIAEYESEQRREFEKLGRIVFYDKKNESSNESEVERCAAAIELLDKKIAYTKSKIDKLKEKVVCGNCNEKSEKNSRFCGNCGTDLCFDESQGNKKDKNEEEKCKFKEEDDDDEDD
jgi:predicted RNase H-like nuclease (RuvC/YqgF family)